MQHDRGVSGWSCDFGDFAKVRSLSSDDSRLKPQTRFEVCGASSNTLFVTRASVRSQTVWVIAKHYIRSVAATYNSSSSHTTAACTARHSVSTRFAVAERWSPEWTFRLHLFLWLHRVFAVRPTFIQNHSELQNVSLWRFGQRTQAATFVCSCVSSNNTRMDEQWKLNLAKDRGDFI